MASETKVLEVGENIFAVGNPEGLVGTISPGTVSASIRSSQKKARIQITAPISHGSSGGPIVDATGKVVGVAVGALSEGQNLNFAVPVSLIHFLLKDSSEDVSFTLALDSIVNEDKIPPEPWSRPALREEPVAKVEAPISVIGFLRKGETREQASLRKLPGVFLMIGDISSVTGQIISQNQLKTEVELRLRRNRIRILSEEEWIRADGSPTLFLTLSALKHNTGVYSFSYSLELSQDILLRRDKSFGMSGTTWSRGSYGYAGSQVVSTAVKDAIGEIVDSFCNDFLAANTP